MTVLGAVLSGAGRRSVDLKILHTKVNGPQKRLAPQRGGCGEVVVGNGCGGGAATVRCAGAYRG